MLAFFSLLILACNQNESNDEEILTTAQRASNDYTLKTIFSKNVFNLEKLSTYKAKVENYGINKEVSTQRIHLNENSFEVLMNDFSKFYNVNLLTYKIRGVVFYGDSVNIDLSDFRNVTFIVLDDNGYAKYISYKNNTSKLELVENNLQKHSLILMNYFSYLGTKLNEKNNSMLIAINEKDFGLSIDTQIADNLLKSKIDKTILEEYEIIPVSYQSTMGSYCNISECYSRASGDCAWDDGSRDVICYEFSNGICHDEESDEYYNDKVIRPNGYKAAMYSIRDNFLINTLKGKQYIDFYYKLSHVFKVSNLYSSEEKSLIEITNFIRNKSIAFILGNSNDIIISNNDYNELKAYIVNFKTINENKEYQYN